MEKPAFKKGESLRSQKKVKFADMGNSGGRWQNQI